VVDVPASVSARDVRQSAVGIALGGEGGRSFGGRLKKAHSVLVGYIGTSSLIDTTPSESKLQAICRATILIDGVST
jgi:hypothetical protein